MPIHGKRQIISDTEAGIKKEIVFKLSHWEALEALAEQRGESVESVLSSVCETYVETGIVCRPQDLKQAVLNLENRVRHLEHEKKNRPPSVRVRFGTANKIDATLIEVPITLSEAVDYLSASDFEVTGVDNVVMELDTSAVMKLLLQLPLDVSGTLMIDAVGSVVIEKNGRRGVLSSTPIAISYNTK